MHHPSGTSEPSAPRRARLRWTMLGLAALLAVPVIAVASGVPNDVRIPMLKDRQPGDPPDAGLFSHWSHSSYQCFSCHPGVFPKHRVGFTHADMEAGGYCGACHDGKTTWAPKQRGVDCERCHVPSKEEDDDDDIFDQAQAWDWVRLR